MRSEGQNETRHEETDISTKAKTHKKSTPSPNAPQAPFARSMTIFEMLEVIVKHSKESWGRYTRTPDDLAD